MFLVKTRHNFYPIIVKLGQNDNLIRKCVILPKYLIDWIKSCGFLAAGRRPRQLLEPLLVSAMFTSFTSVGLVGAFSSNITLLSIAQNCLALLSIAQHCSALLSIAQHCSALESNPAA
jgi:hypothetical protein